MRYAFVRYGVTYVVAIECLDGRARYRHIACSDADKVAVRVFKGLKLVGGLPQATPNAPAASTVDRPTAKSTVFTYYPPGESMRTGKVKRASSTTPSIPYRSPMADAPAFANTQFARSEPSPQNYSLSVARQFLRAARILCRSVRPGARPPGPGYPAGLLPPARPGRALRALHEHDVVAVRDGTVMRAPGQQAIYVVVNAPNERVRVRYLHMSPKRLDADGMVSGRVVRKARSSARYKPSDGPLRVDDLALALKSVCGDRDVTLTHLPLSWNGATWAVPPSARLCRLGRRRRHRRRARTDGRRRARAQGLQPTGRRHLRRRRLHDGRDRGVDRRALQDSDADRGLQQPLVLQRRAAPGARRPHPQAAGGEPLDRPAHLRARHRLLGASRRRRVRSASRRSPRRPIWCRPSRRRSRRSKPAVSQSSTCGSSPAMRRSPPRRCCAGPKAEEVTARGRA